MDELTTSDKRGPGRPPLHRAEPRPIDPRAAATARAAQILEHMGGLDENTDEFYIPAECVPDGWSYEWKEYLVGGAVNPSKQVELQRRGWEFVPTSRHPEMMPADTTEKVISRHGMRLMERPLEITEKVREFDARNARMQVRSKEEALANAPPGTLERANRDNSLVKVKKSYAPLPVAD